MINWCKHIATLIVKSFINDEEQKFKHVLEEGAFTKNSEMTFDHHILYKLQDNGLTTTLELDNYYKKYMGETKLPISKQGYSKQRMKINPLYYGEMNNEIIQGEYEHNKNAFLEYKGFYLLGVDGTQFGIPNTPITREEMEVDPISLKEPNTPKVRRSIIYDLLNGFIIDAQISPLKNGELTLAKKNIENASHIFNLKKSIIIFDRGYATTEIILQTLFHKSNFIIRLRDNTFKKQRLKMKTEDEYINIPLNAIKLKKIQDPELLKLADEIGTLKLRVVNLKLSNGKTETLLTNLPKNIATKEELKKLYAIRWNVEKGYDVLKNKIGIENFTGKLKITIEQDFYSSIVAHNIINEEKIRQTQILEKNKKGIYLPDEISVNNNLLVGQMKENIVKLVLAETEDEKEKLSERMTFIIQRGFLKTPENMDLTRNKKKNLNKYSIIQRRNH